MVTIPSIVTVFNIKGAGRWVGLKFSEGDFELISVLEDSNSDHLIFTV